MRRLLLALVLASFVYTQPANAKSPVGVVRNFGPDLSAQCNLPEGIAADPRGRIYASSLNFNATSGSANICVLDRDGNIVDLISVAPATSSGVAKLLGMLFVPNEGLYVTDIGGGRVIRVDVRTHAVTAIASGFQAPNAIARDRRARDDDLNRATMSLDLLQERGEVVDPAQLAEVDERAPQDGLRDDVERALAAIPPRERSILASYYGEGLSLAAIGRRSG